jgi:hypothetical protein
MGQVLESLSLILNTTKQNKSEKLKPKPHKNKQKTIARENLLGDAESDQRPKGRFYLLSLIFSHRLLCILKIICIVFE